MVEAIVDLTVSVLMFAGKLSCRYGSAILDIKWHHTLNYEQPKLITTDSHVVRIWDPETVKEFI